MINMNFFSLSGEVVGITTTQHFDVTIKNNSGKFTIGFFKNSLGYPSVEKVSAGDKVYIEGHFSMLLDDGAFVGNVQFLGDKIRHL